MAINKTYKVQIPKGYFVSWIVTTQAGYKTDVSLKDDKKTYFAGTKQSVQIDPPLSVGSATLEGNNLVLTISSDGASRLLGIPHSNDIVTEDGTIVGKEFSLYIEDAGDMDYNDIAVRIVGWVNGQR